MHAGAKLSTRTPKHSHWQCIAAPASGECRRGKVVEGQAAPVQQASEHSIGVQDCRKLRLRRLSCSIALVGHAAARECDAGLTV